MQAIYVNNFPKSIAQNCNKKIWTACWLFFHLLFVNEYSIYVIKECIRHLLLSTSTISIATFCEFRVFYRIFEEPEFLNDIFLMDVLMRNSTPYVPM